MFALDPRHVVRVIKDIGNAFGIGPTGIAGGRTRILPLGMPKMLFSSMPKELAVSTTLNRLNPMRTSLMRVGEKVRSHPTTAFWLNATEFGPPIMKTFPGDGFVKFL